VKTLLTDLWLQGKMRSSSLLRIARCSWIYAMAS
jgi:hypothetical protein